MSQQQMIMTLVAETSIHAGSGESDGIIDLPVQRESHTGWPCIFGSAVKGALRATAEARIADNHAGISALFGPDPSGVRNGNGSDFAGALLVGDARLLLLPVRSLTSHTRWVTCPALLRRLTRDLARSGIDLPLGDAWKTLVSDDMQAQVSNSRHQVLYLEEYAFDEDEVTQTALTSALSQLLGDDLTDEIQAQLTVVGDDHFAHLARASVPVNPHIAIDSKTKTVVDGALWFEESLPPETVFYFPVVANAAREKNKKIAASDIMDSFKSLFTTTPYLQVGGNETTGMGWCRVHTYEGESR